MVRGVVIGKFLPPHLGHSYLIHAAAAQCDDVTVLICDRPEYLIPAATRKSWLEAMHPNVSFKIFKDTLDDNDSPGWAKATIRLLGYVPEVVFSSEDYDARWAKYMGSRHQLVDKKRVHIPISATTIRNDPWAAWDYLHPIVRAYFAKRICVVGPESTGTTTLAGSLAKQYATEWVPEYGRTYTVENQKRLSIDGWKTKDFVRIAREQNRQEDELAAKSDKILLCDTDSFATSIWHERYMGLRSEEVEALAAGRHYDLYLLTDVNIPFEDDGTRDGEAYREWMHKRFQEKLRFWGKPFVVISGDKNQRLRRATQIIDTVMNDDAVKIPGLIRNAWHPNGGL